MGRVKSKFVIGCSYLQKRSCSHQKKRLLASPGSKYLNYTDFKCYYVNLQTFNNKFQFFQCCTEESIFLLLLTITFTMLIIFSEENCVGRGT